MKVLWFTNVPLPAVCKRVGLRLDGMSGHWMAALADQLACRDDIQLAVVTAFPDVPNETFDEGNVRYCLIGQPKRYPVFGMSEADLRKAATIVENFRPDIVHVHGTERFFGLVKARGLCTVPEAVSLQGLLGPYSTYANFFGALSPTQVISSTRLMELPMRLGLLWGYWDMQRAAKREIEILQHADAFLGRTRWDRAHAKVHGPTTPYYHVNEILRSEFAATQWSPSSIDRHSIIYTNAGHPRRGTEVLLDAVRDLKSEFPDIRLRLAGTISSRSGYGRFLTRRISRGNLYQHINMLGPLNSQQMAQELSRTHVFCIASYIENSPNSLAEAMMVGMPCVASYVGGIPDMVDSEETGLLFPAGDAALLADSIRMIFRNDDLARQLGSKARDVALQRHNPETVLRQLLLAYQDILKSSHPQ